MAVQKNFEIDQNTTFSFIVEYKDSEGEPINLTGSTAKMQARETQGGSKLAFTLTSPFGGLVIDGPAGKITCTMTPTQTNKLFYPKSAYDLVIIDSNSNKIRLLEGYITLSRSVTI